MSTDAVYKIELQITDQHGLSSSLELNEGEYFLGRDDTCEIRFPQSAKMVSRKHAQITVAPGGTRLCDLESRCGTMVNGKVVREHDVEDGDVINIANYNIRIALPERAESRESLMVVPTSYGLDEEVEGLANQLEALKNSTQALTDQIGKRIVGQESIIMAIWATILAKGHCLMVGVPGLAKTYMVTSFADAMGLESNRIQFTPDLMPSDIIGSNVLKRTEDGTPTFHFEQGPVFTQLLLADEINRTPPKTQAALLEAMQERQVTVEKRSLNLPNIFCVIATQNPIEQEGTYPLPEAQLDRFLLCLSLDYPEADDEVEILLRTTHGSVPDIEAALGYEEILKYQTLIDRIAVGKEVAEYAAKITRATRPGKDEAPDFVREMVDWGAGPRAGQGLVRMAKAVAAIDGRPAISHDDVREAVLPVMRHRISCNYRARSERMDEDSILSRLLDEFPAP